MPGGLPGRCCLLSFLLPALFIGLGQSTQSKVSVYSCVPLCRHSLQEEEGGEAEAEAGAEAGAGA